MVDSGELGGSVESEIWELLDADQAVADDIVYVVAAALRGDEELADQLGRYVPAPRRPEVIATNVRAPLRAFLRSITVEGFRGIGRRTTLELNRYRGIAVSRYHGDQRAQRLWEVQLCRGPRIRAYRYQLPVGHQEEPAVGDPLEEPARR